MKKITKIKKEEPKITYKFVEGLSEEAQRRLDSAFEILFNAVIRKRNNK